MKNSYLKLILLSVIFTVVNLLQFSFLQAQPLNDKCYSAIPLNVFPNVQSIVWTDGSTINTTDSALDTLPPIPCSANFYRDDVWYTLEIPAAIESKLVVLKFNLDSLPTDLKAVGIAVYNNYDCSINNYPFSCQSVLPIEDSKIILSGLCHQKLLIRVFSAEGTDLNWEAGQGTFRIGVYLDEDKSKTKILWGANGEGSFDGGLNGWKIGGDYCAGNKPSSIPLWEWRKNADSHGLFWGGQYIKSKSACNGSMIFDSDFYDKNGAGDCLAPQHSYLESPLISFDSLKVNGITLEFRQRVTQFQSLYYIDYSIDGGQNFFTLEINQELEPFTTVTPPGVDPTVDEFKSLYLPKTSGAKSIILRFRIES